MFRLAALVGFVSLAACASIEADSVKQLIESRAMHDGQPVQVVGTLRYDNGIVNLYSRDVRECIGLLTYVEQQEHYRRLDGRHVRVTGLLDAEGCGLRGFCVERLCGPAVIRQVTATPL